MSQDVDSHITLLHEVFNRLQHLVDVCAERGLVLANTFFQHKMIHRYTWRRREDRGEEKRKEGKRYEGRKGKANWGKGRKEGGER